MDDRGGWTPKPITPPSAGINRFMPSSSRGMSHSQPQPGGSRHSRPPQVHPATMPQVPSRALSPYHSPPYPSAHLPTEFAPAQNHFNASPQYYHGATPDLGGAPSFVNPAFLNQSNGGTYVPPAGRHVPHPSTWPNMMYASPVLILTRQLTSAVQPGLAPALPGPERGFQPSMTISILPCCLSMVEYPAGCIIQPVSFFSVFTIT